MAGESEQFIDLGFPLRGIDTQAEVGGQPGETVARAVNVRGLDPRTLRLRGASRCGLTKFIDERVGGLNSVIQHMAVIVDPTTEGLATDADALPPGTTEYPPDWVPWPDPDDPRFPLGPPYIPPGGSGIPPSPLIPPLDPPPDEGAEEYVALQTNTNSNTEPGGDDNIVAVPFGVGLTAGSQIVIHALWLEIGGELSAPADATVTCVDSQGNVYQATAGGIQTFGGPNGDPGTPQLSKVGSRIFYVNAQAGANTATVTLVPGTAGDLTALVVVAHEFSGPGTTNTLEDNGVGQGVAADGTNDLPLAPGALSQDGPGRLCVIAAVIVNTNSGGLSASPIDFDQGSNIYGGAGTQPSMQGYYGYVLVTPSGATFDPILTLVNLDGGSSDNDEVGWVASGAIFRRS